MWFWARAPSLRLRAKSLSKQVSLCCLSEGSVQQEQKWVGGPGATAVRLTGRICPDVPLPLSRVLLPLSAAGRQPCLDPGAGERGYMAGNLPAGGSRPRLIGEGRWS